MARSAIINVMVQAAMKAGRSLARDFGEVQNLQVSLKGPGDYVSQADRKAEEIIHAELSKARPGYAFLMEERGAVEGDDDQHRWIVDPLDGTTNFLHGIPIFSISIALERQGQIVAGVIYNPAMDELYTAERGGGAQSLRRVPSSWHFPVRQTGTFRRFPERYRTVADLIFLPAQRVRETATSHAFSSWRCAPSPTLHAHRTHLPYMRYSTLHASIAHLPASYGRCASSRRRRARWRRSPIA